MSIAKPDPIPDSGITALILKNSPFGEGHRLLTLLDHIRGKIIVMAFGAGKEKSTRRSALLTGYIIDARLNRKKEGSPQSLKEVTVLQEFTHVRRDLPSLAYFFLLLEVLDICLEEGSLWEGWPELAALLTHLDQGIYKPVQVWHFLFCLLRTEGVFPAEVAEHPRLLGEFGYKGGIPGNGTLRFLRDSAEHPEPAFWHNKNLSASVQTELQDILTVTVRHHYGQELNSLHLLQPSLSG